MVAIVCRDDVHRARAHSHRAKVRASATARHVLRSILLFVLCISRVVVIAVVALALAHRTRARGPLHQEARGGGGGLVRSLAANNPAREQGVFGQIAAALRNGRTPGQQPNNDETDMAPCLPSAPQSIAVAAAAIAGPKIA